MTTRISVLWTEALPEGREEPASVAWTHADHVEDHLTTRGITCFTADFDALGGITFAVYAPLQSLRIVYIECWNSGLVTLSRNSLAVDGQLDVCTNPLVETLALLPSALSWLQETP